MTTNWRDKTCETCVFQVNEECRRFPPQRGSTLSGFYPTVRGDIDFALACAEYAEQQEPKPPCPCNQPTATDISGTHYCVACGAKH